MGDVGRYCMRHSRMYTARGISTVWGRDIAQIKKKSCKLALKRKITPDGSWVKIWISLENRLGGVNAHFRKARNEVGEIGNVRKIPQNEISCGNAVYLSHFASWNGSIYRPDRPMGKAGQLYKTVDILGSYSGGVTFETPISTSDNRSGMSPGNIAYANEKRNKR